MLQTFGGNIANGIASKNILAFLTALCNSKPKSFWGQCHWQCCQPKVGNTAKTRWFGPLFFFMFRNGKCVHRIELWYIVWCSDEHFYGEIHFSIERITYILGKSWVEFPRPSSKTLFWKYCFSHEWPSILKDELNFTMHHLIHLTSICIWYDAMVQKGYIPLYFYICK